MAKALPVPADDLAIAGPRDLYNRLRGNGTFRLNPETERAMLAGLPGMPDRIDEQIEEGVLDGEELYAADFMIAPSLAVLTYRADVAEEIERRPARHLLDRLLPEPPRGKAPDRSLRAASPAARG